jgi:oxalate decarboxylase/phosphoglucose isomerase-like protein (cupin superfamily)
LDQGPLGIRRSRGDVGYIPQGMGHSLENVGTDTVRVLIVFNNARTIDLYNGSPAIRPHSRDEFQAGPSVFEIPRGTSS